MMKRIWIICFGLCFLLGCTSVIKREDIFMQSRQIKAAAVLEAVPATTEEKPSVTVNKPVVDPVSKPLSSFSEIPKEKLAFKAKYLGIPFCEYIIQNKGKTNLNGREVYLLEIAVKTNPILMSLFKNKDLYVSYMDVENMVVLRHEEYVNKGLMLESVVEFDYVNHVARYKNFIDHKEKTTPIPNKVHDIVSGGFYLRMVPWELGDTVELNIYADEIIYNFIGLVRSKTILNLPVYGRKNAYMLKPYLFEKGVQVKNLSAESFFSTTVPRTPLRAVINTFLGGVSVALVEELEDNKGKN